MFALGDISGKGLAAGMWTTHLVGNKQSPPSSDPERIVAGVNHDPWHAFDHVLAAVFARLDPTRILEYWRAGIRRLCC